MQLPGLRVIAELGGGIAKNLEIKRNTLLKTNQPLDMALCTAASAAATSSGVL